MNNTAKILKPAVFLDRDGTLNIEKEYLHRVEDFEFIPGVPEALKRLQDAGYLLVVVTNQSGVARGYFSVEDVQRLHQHMQHLLNAFEVKIDAFYLCPHHPTQGIAPYDIDCDCRKGKPGMLLQGAEELGIDLSSSFMVGDKLADIEAGIAAGCRSLLVRTGYGESVEAAGQIQHAKVYDDLSQAIVYILQIKKLNDLDCKGDLLE